MKAPPTRRGFFLVLSTPPARQQFCIVQFYPMQLNSALAAVLGGQFLLDESAVPAFMLQAGRLLTEGGPTAPRPTEQPTPPVVHAISLDATSVQLRGYGSLDDVPAGSVAITTVNGVMMPYDEYDYDYGYLPGTRSLAARMQQADAHPNIVAHVVQLATPGGSTLGLEAFANALEGCQKPVVGYIEMMCSAGLWFGSGCDVLVIARTGIAGSIGTKWDGMDFSGFYQKMGMVPVTVTATDSTDKTKMFDEALKGKPALLRTQLLDPLNNEFLAVVKTNRPDVSTDALTGKLYVGQNAIDAGLADQLGSFQDAIQLAFDLADAAGLVGGSTYSASLSLSPSTTSHTTMGLFGSSKTTALAAVAALSGKTGLTATDTKAANEELVAAGITDAAIITKAEYIDLTAKAGRAEAAEQSVTALTADKTKLTADLTAANAEVTRLGALGGATPTASGKKDGDDQGEAPKAHAWFNTEHDHNKEANALLG
jgi:ClpP class serine protease